MFQIIFFIIIHHVQFSILRILFFNYMKYSNFMIALIFLIIHLFIFKILIFALKFIIFIFLTIILILINSHFILISSIINFNKTITFSPFQVCFFILILTLHFIFVIFISSKLDYLFSQNIIYILRIILYLVFLIIFILFYFTKFHLKGGNTPHF